MLFRSSIIARTAILATFFFMLGCSGTAADEMTSTIVIGSSHIDVNFDPTNWKVTQPQLLNWAQKAAEAVATYYGRYPRPHVRLRILPSSGHGVRGGMTWGRDGGLIRIRVGADTTVEELNDDWMLTHEMVHLAFPSMEDEHHWIEEGLATYVEPIARIQAGQMSADGMWADLVRDLPKGQPDDGDRGLDHTHTWGRTYWGGALFCFVADVEIRKKTHNRKGLQDAMRAIFEQGGDITQDWTIERALKTGDDAVGVSVLLPLYENWKDKPVQVDLTALWADLGIVSSGGPLHYSEKAASAPIRRAITAAQTLSGNGAKTKVGLPVGVIAGRRIDHTS